MPRWLLLALTTAVAYGLFNAFASKAGGRISDAWGAALLEGAAALVILAYAAVTRAAPEGTLAGVGWSVAAGVFAGIGTLAYIAMFRHGGGLTRGGPVAFCGSMLVMVAVGAVLFGEVLSARRAVGLALGILSVALLR